MDRFLHFYPKNLTKLCPGRTKKCTPARSPEQSRLMCNVYECEFACICLFWRHSEWQRTNKLWQKAKGKLWVELSSSCAECWLSKPSNSLMFVSAFVWSQAGQQVCVFITTHWLSRTGTITFLLKTKQNNVSCLMAQNSYNGNIRSDYQVFRKSKFALPAQDNNRVVLQNTKGVVVFYATKQRIFQNQKQCGVTWPTDKLCQWLRIQKAELFTATRMHGSPHGDTPTELVFAFLSIVFCMWWVSQPPSPSTKMRRRLVMVLRDGNSLILSTVGGRDLWHLGHADFGLGWAMQTVTPVLQDKWRSMTRIFLSRCGGD